MLKPTVKKLAALTLCALLALPLAACQENPEGSIVAHKDMEKLLSEAAASDPEKVGAADVAQEAETAGTYQTTVENEELGVKVNVNAQVEAPKVEQLSVYRVAQKKFDQAFLDKARALLLGDTPLYDGSMLNVRTQRQVEQEIASWRQAMDSLEDDYRSGEGAADLTEEDIQGNIQVIRQEYQNEIDRLQEAYESAPAELDREAYASDGRLRTVEELAALYPGEYYQWQQSLAGQGDQVFYGVNGGGGGEYSLLYVQNNADHSNKLAYRRSPKGYAHFNGVSVGGSGLAQAEQMGKDSFRGFAPGEIEAFWQEKGLTTPVLTGGISVSESMEFEPLYPDAALSQEEAQRIAGDLLAELGLRDFVLDEGGLYTELVDMQNYGSAEKAVYARYYILHYRRQIEGVTLSQSSGEKYADNRDQGGRFNKQFWPGELIELRVNDSGVVGFDYHAPLEITETVVEGAALKTFEDVKSTFEKMLPVTLAQTEESRIAAIDRVRLSYSRISEKDSFDTGLIVPVWSFEGSVDFYYNQDNGEKSYSDTQTGVLLAVNAIDGSIIDGRQGY